MTWVFVPSNAFYLDFLSVAQGRFIPLHRLALLLGTPSHSTPFSPRPTQVNSPKLNSRVISCLNIFFLFLFLFFQHWELNSGSTDLHSFPLLGDKVSSGCLGWPQACNLPALASQVVGITGVHHCAQIMKYFLTTLVWLDAFSELLLTHQ